MSNLDTSPDFNYETPSAASPDPPPKEPAMAEEARGAAARRTARSAHKEPAELIPTVSDEASFDAVPFGGKFKDPEGNIRKRPYTVSDEADFAKVPEGAEFTDPEGNLRTKPKYEGIDVTSQILYNMAVNDKERRKALEFGYPGKVKQYEGTDQLYVDDDGVLRKPRGMTETAPGMLAGIAALAAPTVGVGAGGIAGGIAGSAAGGVGAAPGAFGGATVGGMGGQAFNDLVMQLAGVYDRSTAEEVGGLGMAALLGGGGELAGRAVAGAMAGGPASAKGALPSMANKALGTDPEGLKQGIALREKGVLVPPSQIYKEAPHLANLTQVLDPAFRTQKPLLQSAQQHMERSATEILEELGVKVEGSLQKPTAEVSTIAAGKAAKDRMISSAAEADRKLEEALTVKLAAAPEKVDAQTEVLKTAEQSRQQVEKLIQGGLKEIETDVDKAMKVADAGSNSGDIWWMASEKFQTLKRAATRRFERYYEQSYQAGAGHIPNSEGLAPIAKEFVETLPDGFEAQFPMVVRNIKSWAGDAEKGIEPTAPDFKQLHQTRSLLREKADWLALASDRTNGAYKFFSKKLDDVLHDAGATPELKLAARLLDATDTAYAKDMAIFNAAELRTLMKGIEAGEPADAQKLYSTLIKNGKSDLTRKFMDMLGPELSNAIRATDKDAMLKASMTNDPGRLDYSEFAKQVLKRKQNGMLDLVHGEKQGSELSRLAEVIDTWEGKIVGDHRPGDTALDVARRAKEMGEAARAVGNKDPLAMLAQAKISAEKEHARSLAQARLGRSKEKLGFLYDPKVGEMTAVNKILGNEDLVLAAAERFGPESTEFNLLRQVYVENILRQTLEPGAKLASISPEVQRIMLKGNTLESMQLLAKEMAFLMGGKGMGQDAGRSIMATERVEHPSSGFIGKAGTVLKLPGADFLMRSILTKYYAFFTEASNNIAFMRWLEKGLKGDEAGRAAVRARVQRAMQYGGAIGSTAAEGQYQTPQQPEAQ